MVRRGNDCIRMGAYSEDVDHLRPLRECNETETEQRGELFKIPLALTETQRAHLGSVRFVLLHVPLEASAPIVFTMHC